MEKVDQVDVVLVLAEGIGCDASHFQPGVVEEVRHGVEERQVATNESGAAIFLSELVTEHRNEAEAVDGDGDRLDQGDGDVVAGEFDDVSAALLQR